MRRIIYWVHTSADGHIDGPNGEFDWASLGPDLDAYSQSLIDRCDVLLYGRAVWDMMASFWPHAESMSDDPHDLKFARIWRTTPKLVVSRTLTDPGWDTRVIRDLDELAEAKRQPGRDILLTGGSELAAALTARGLIDEYHVAVHPVVLGGGKRLFAAPVERMPLRLAGSTPCDGRTVVLHYEPVTDEGSA